MRSIAFTLFLALLAAAACGVLGWQMREGNLNVLFGTPPVKPGHRLYTNINPSEVAKITVIAHGIKADFVKTPDGWRAADAPQDRMDPVSALRIIAFTMNLNVRDFAETDDVDRDQAGLRDDSVRIQLSTASGTELANYRMGDRTPLKSENKDSTQLDNTVFIQPRDRDLKGYIYACTGDISPLFRDGLKYLRDHKPFYFSPQLLEKIRIRGSQGELTLSRENMNSPWRIVKPLELRTDPAVVKSLIENLYNLEAVKIADRSAVTLPGAESASKTFQLAISQFGVPGETLLEVFPPDSADAQEALATISNRPQTVFYLPLKPKVGYTSLANLDVTVNDLRDKAITSLNIASLKAILIRPQTGKEILITREPPKPWEVEINGDLREANEKKLFDLLRALTTGRAIGFPSDAATDLTPWGLNKPFLTIGLLGEEKQTITLDFGMDGSGGVFVNRRGTLIVMRIDPSLLSDISIQPHEWRHARPWSVSKVDLKSIERQVRQDPPLILPYDFIEESWKAEKEGQDISPTLDPAKANHLLDALVDLNVTRWLAVGDAEAAAALATPLLSLTITERVPDELGDTKGENRRTLTIASAPGDNNPTSFFGQITGEPHPFILDRDLFRKLAVDPLEK